MVHQLTIMVHPGRYAICRLEPDAPLPIWATVGNFLSVTRTAQELSIVCIETVVPGEIHAERKRRLLQIEGTLTLAFGLSGVLASVAEPLAKAEISISVISTYDADYLLISEDDLPAATDVLEAAGHTIRQSK
jgi:hypothetical protein